MKRRLRRAIEFGLPIVGMLIIFGSVLFVPPDSLQIQVVVVLAGVLILEAGVWGLTTGILPNERRYLALREEGDHFLSLIRGLNHAAVERNHGAAGASEKFQEAVRLMHASVVRMANVAGQEHTVVESDDAAHPTEVATSTPIADHPSRTSAPAADKGDRWARQ